MSGSKIESTRDGRLIRIVCPCSKKPIITDIGSDKKHTHTHTQVWNCAVIDVCVYVCLDDEGLVIK